MQWVGVALISFYVVFGALLPIGGLIFRSFTRIFTPLQSPFRSLTGDNYERIVGFPVYLQSIWNSLIVAGVGSILVSLLALLAVVVARRSTFRYRRLVEYLALAPQAIPGSHRPCQLERLRRDAKHGIVTPQRPATIDLQPVHPGRNPIEGDAAVHCDGRAARHTCS